MTFKRKTKGIYESQFVENLFDHMSGSYAKVNYITSFGFSTKWRKQCVDEIQIEKGKTVVDLMTGMGECWKHILKKGDQHSLLIGLDFSSEMVRRASLNKKKFGHAHIQVLQENVFQNSIENESADYVISGFGLKTFNAEQLHLLANEIDRVLKPGGQFSLIDVSVPKNKLLKALYLFYLKSIIPVLGWLFLGNPETYKMLGIYTEAFKNAKETYTIFNSKNFDIEYMEYFYGCASGIKGTKL